MNSFSVGGRAPRRRGPFWVEHLPAVGPETSTKSRPAKRVGPLYAEAFVSSDVLGSRLMGAEVTLDVGHVLCGNIRPPGCSSCSVAAVHVTSVGLGVDNAR